MDDVIIYIGATLIGGMFGFFFGALVFGDANGTDLQQRTIICHYEGGQVQGDVCIKDGSVITIDLPGDN